MHALFRTLLLSALLLAATAAPTRAQAADHDAVYLVVTSLFDAMRTRDTATMRSVFAPGAVLQSVSGPQIRTDEINAWIASVAGAPAELVLDERLANPVVQVSGALATVWVDYWFYAGERFSHCGVDAFILAKIGADWRILSVADTRQREGCAPAPAR
jgi:hypothetical protein